MADNIIRLKVESDEAERRLKNASRELLNMAENARRTGADLKLADQEELAFVESLGRMQTSARTARASVNELSAAYTELSVHYRKLSDSEKNSPYGRALSESLAQLKERITSAKTELSEIDLSVKTSGGAMDGLSSVVEALSGKLGISVAQFGALGVAVGAATVAAKVAKDAFFNNEQQLDEWGRTVESAKSLYEGFLNSLNTGDISGFLTRINEIVNAARDAYDAMDELGTYNAFNQVNESKARDRYQKSLADYKEGSGSASDVREAMNALIAELRQRQSREQETYNAAIGRLAEERGVKASDLMRVARGSYDDYVKAKGVMPSREEYKPSQISMFGPFQYGVTKVAANEAEKLGEALRSINDTEWEEIQKLGAKSYQTSQEIEQLRRSAQRLIGAGQQRGTSASGSTVVDTRANDIAVRSIDAAYTSYKRSASDVGSAGVMEDELQRQRVGQMGSILTSSMKGVDPQLMTRMFQMDGSRSPVSQVSASQSRDGEKEQRRNTDALKQMNRALGGLNQIAGGLNQLGIELPKGLTNMLGVMNGLMSIINGAQTIISVINAVTLPSQTAALVANTAALYTVAATNFLPFAGGGIVRGYAGGGIVNGYTGGITIKGYANGGIIGPSTGFVRAANGFVSGTRFSGDQIPIAVNSGEMILNRAQQGNLAAQLSEGGMNGMELGTIITGEQLKIVLRRHLRRTNHNESIG